MWLYRHVTELWQWLIALPPDFAFLLSLPFMVVLAGLISEVVRKHKGALATRRSGAAGGHRANIRANAEHGIKVRIP